MKKLYNGNEANLLNILNMIRECTRNSWQNSDLYRQSELVFEKMLLLYDGIEEDFEYILDRIPDYSNLQDIESVIIDGEWNFGKWISFKEDYYD